MLTQVSATLPSKNESNFNSYTCLLKLLTQASATLRPSKAAVMVESRSDFCYVSENKGLHVCRVQRLELHVCSFYVLKSWFVVC